MKNVLVTVQDEALSTTISEVLGALSAEMVSESDPTVDQVEQLRPAVVIVDYAGQPAEAENFFHQVIEYEPTARIPFMFIVPDGEKWREIDGFRLGFDTKVSKERPKMGIELRVQAILKKSRISEDRQTKAKDLQQIVQSILKKARIEDTGALSISRALPSRPKLLIVEDEELTREILQSALEIRYELVFATNGLEGYERAVAERPDMIISDFNMPIMDGGELLEKIRADHLFRRTPFLFLTAKNSVDERITGLERGADEYIGKPFAVRELQLRVDRLVEQATRQSSSLQGDLSEISLPDVLQMVANNQKSGVLSIESEAANGQKVRLLFQEGRLINAEYGRNKGIKAFYRTLFITEGKFYLENKELDAKQVINDKLENLLLEGYRQMDEFEMLRARFANGFEAHLRPGTEKAVSSGLSQLDAIALFAVGAGATVGEVLNQVNYTDYEVLESIINLLEAGLIVAD
jgi:DNA-binding response OmpR family regulator